MNHSNNLTVTEKELHNALMESLMAQMLELIQAAMFEIRHLQIIMNFKAELTNTLPDLFCEFIPYLLRQNEMWTREFVLCVQI